MAQQIEARLKSESPHPIASLEVRALQAFMEYGDWCELHAMANRLQCSASELRKLWGKFEARGILEIRGES